MLNPLNKDWGTSSCRDKDTDLFFCLAEQQKTSILDHSRFGHNPDIKPCFISNNGYVFEAEESKEQLCRNGKKLGMDEDEYKKINEQV